MQSVGVLLGEGGEGEGRGGGCQLIGAEEDRKEQRGEKLKL